MASSERQPFDPYRGGTRFRRYRPDCRRSRARALHLPMGDARTVGRSRLRGRTARALGKRKRPNRRARILLPQAERSLRLIVVAIPTSSPLDRITCLVPILHPAAQNAYLLEPCFRKHFRRARRALLDSSNGYYRSRLALVQIPDFAG